jgi:hypothetical protein
MLPIALTFSFLFVSWTWCFVLETVLKCVTILAYTKNPVLRTPKKGSLA